MNKQITAGEIALILSALFAKQNPDGRVALEKLIKNTVLTYEFDEPVYSIREDAEEWYSNLKEVTESQNKTILEIKKELEE
ncbi:hypothetical protein [Companilactobacillus metriopterae]|uniref:hypothetical protein n=1 Tax=Companilactobacillus metriopterae TaxID=1909267 RepID=UPI00100B12B2|nr:hypothetical protein [Companilactobacillus metriopterae]